MKLITKKLNIKFKTLWEKKKRGFCKTNLRQKINRPKKLWKTLKSIGSPSKDVTASNKKNV